MIFSFSKCRNYCRIDLNLILGHSFDTLKRKNHCVILYMYHTDSINTLYKNHTNSSIFCSITGDHMQKAHNGKKQANGMVFTATCICIDMSVNFMLQKTNFKISQFIMYIFVI